MMMNRTMVPPASTVPNNAYSSNMGSFQGAGGMPPTAVSDDVIKFLLKLKSNNIQNLKNALRKLGERTFGNKE